MSRNAAVKGLVLNVTLTEFLENYNCCVNKPFTSKTQINIVFFFFYFCDASFYKELQRVLCFLCLPPGDL